MGFNSSFKGLVGINQVWTKFNPAKITVTRALRNGQRGRKKVGGLVKNLLILSFQREKESKERTRPG